METQLKPWDISVALLVREAGGRVTDLDQGVYDSSSGRILAANGLVHEELAEVHCKHQRLAGGVS